METLKSTSVPVNKTWGMRFQILAIMFFVRLINLMWQLIMFIGFIFLFFPMLFSNKQMNKHKIVLKRGVL